MNAIKGGKLFQTSRFQPKNVNSPRFSQLRITSNFSQFYKIGGIKETLYLTQRRFGHSAGHPGGIPEFYEEPHKVEKPRWFFTREEVAKHNSKDDCWIIIHGKVYDITEWILFHPGLDVIATNAGYDSTELFEAAGHRKAVDYMHKFYIGDIVEGEKKRRFTCNWPTQNPNHYE